MAPSTVQPPPGKRQRTSREEWTEQSHTVWKVDKWRTTWTKTWTWSKDSDSGEQNSRGRDSDEEVEAEGDSARQNKNHWDEWEREWDQWKRQRWHSTDK